jgi:hypothetical protein
MSRIVEHAQRELDRCGQYAADPGYAQSLICTVAAFASYGHSGGSAEVAIEQLNNLLRFEALSPLTDDPAEWEDRSDMSTQPWWQSIRDSRAMSHDGGKTYWLVDEQPRQMHVSDPVLVRAS